ncbi:MULTISPECIES: hypothetical protein [Bacillus cereus group]|uniref:Phr family secreted Rap phosphatase inhibitor n=2 Tax=Bacillus cereus group TaxID=86661 RepID=A0AAW4QUQ9_BACCE|nr:MULTISPECIES: hypothetical protein [Bacillus cereus group]MBY0036477.1 hypothetical protein [Bacillus cereus]MCU4862531.1 hypothetical protein [Bacillus cereus]MDZ5475115.1 hypothetical protein [Bacillus thuringiensis]QUG98284.1 hypothetical protein HCM98_26440 [Bacillus tropicus]
MRKIGILLLGVVGALALTLNTGVAEKEYVASKQLNNENVQYMSSEPGGY